MANKIKIMDVEFNKAVAFLLKEIAYTEDLIEKSRENLVNIPYYDQRFFFECIAMRGTTSITVNELMEFMHTYNIDITFPES